MRAEACCAVKNSWSLHFSPLESFIMYEEWNMTISTPSFSLSNFASILPAPSCLPSPLSLLWHLVSHALYLSPIRAACIHGCGAIPTKHPLGSYQLPIALQLEGIPTGSSPTHSLTVAGLTAGLTSCRCYVGNHSCCWARDCNRHFLSRRQHSTAFSLSSGSWPSFQTFFLGVPCWVRHWQRRPS